MSEEFPERQQWPPFFEADFMLVLFHLSDTDTGVFFDNTRLLVVSHKKLEMRPGFKGKLPTTARECFDLLGFPKKQHAKTEAQRKQQEKESAKHWNPDPNSQGSSKVSIERQQSKPIQMQKKHHLEEEDAEELDTSIENPFTDSSSEHSFSSNDPSYDPFMDTNDKSEMSESEDEDEAKEAVDGTRNDQHDVNLSMINEIIENSNDSVQSEVYPYPCLTQSFSSTVTKPDVVVAQRTCFKNKWDKKHACKFCKKEVTKMSTHLQRVHKEETEVCQVLMLKKGSKERRKAWGKLLNEGDYEHNFSVLKEGSGTLIPKYRSKNKKVDNCVTCPYCKAMYLNNLLAHHVSTCLENPGVVQKRGQSVREGTLLMPVPQKFSEGFYRNVLQNMKQDDILRLIKNDHLLISFGERLYYRKDLEEHTSGHISGRLRELGRLLKCLRQKSQMKISTMMQALHVSNFDTLISCVRELADFDESCNQFKKGTLALKIGYSLKKCASVLKAEAIKKDDNELKQQAQSFEDLVSGNWYDMISATASQSIYRARQNKPRLLPACEDIQKLHILLNQKCESKDYATLAKATLCLISLFNRKRGGEVQRIKVADFEKGMLCGNSADEDILHGLSKAEKKMMNYFNRIEIRGKFNRTVPVLLTSQMVRCIKSVLHLRQNMVPPIDSPYLFATQTGVRPYRGSDVIREFAKESNVKDLTIFTFTHLRKQIATLSQTMEISKWEQDQLAKFLGHDIRIHRNVYRQPSDVLDRAKVAKILLNVNKGVSLSPEDIIIDENEELEDPETNDSTVADDDNLSGTDEDEGVDPVENEKEERNVLTSLVETSARSCKGPSLQKELKH